MSRSRNRHIVEGGEIFSGQRGVEMAAPAHIFGRGSVALWFSVILCGLCVALFGI